MVLEFFALLALIIFSYVIYIFNSLIKSRNRVRNAWAQIDVQLKKRADIVYNLVEIVKGYAKHEKTLFENVTAQRSSITRSSNQSEVIKESNLLSQSFKSIFAVAENYPKLKADKNFLDLQNQLVKIENDIAYARMVYNDVITIYNTSIHTFPNNVLASVFGFHEHKLLEADVFERASKPVSL